jgi:hypothetical protein
MTDRDSREVVVTDVRIPFLSLVALLVKVTIAAIPAYVILLLIGLLVVGFVSALGTGFAPNQ